jgi:hypothetical protein
MNGFLKAYPFSACRRGGSQSYNLCRLVILLKAPLAEFKWHFPPVSRYLSIGVYVLIRHTFSGGQVILGVQDSVGHESFTKPITIQNKIIRPIGFGSEGMQSRRRCLWVSDIL